MTDSIVAAAQFACYQDPEEEEAPDTVNVVGMLQDQVYIHHSNPDLS